MSVVLISLATFFIGVPGMLFIIRPSIHVVQLPGTGWAVSNHSGGKPVILKNIVNKTSWEVGHVLETRTGAMDYIAPGLSRAHFETIKPGETVTLIGLRTRGGGPIRVKVKRLTPFGVEFNLTISPHKLRGKTASL